MDLEQEAKPRATLTEALNWSIALIYKFDEAIRHFLGREIWLDRFRSTSGLFPALAERFDPRGTDPHLGDRFVDAISSLRLSGMEQPGRDLKGCWPGCEGNGAANGLQHTQDRCADHLALV
jgi:hypothetical protein